MRLLANTNVHAIALCCALAALACSSKRPMEADPNAQAGQGAGAAASAGGQGGEGAAAGMSAVAGAGDSLPIAGTDAGDDATQLVPEAPHCGASLPRIHAFDAQRAVHGQALLQNVTLTPGVLPELIVRNLWLAWGSAPPATDADFWAQARARYGMIEAPFDNGGLPLGMRREATGIAFDCMLCHGGRIAGTTILGAANGTIDLESFFDDLLVLRDLAPTIGIPAPPVPFDLDGLTSAAGVHDAFGLGFRLAGPLSDGVNKVFGPQRAPAWWLLHLKERAFVDGSGDASSHRTMMATLVAFGITPDQLIARDADFVAIADYIRSLEAPCWTLTALDAAKVERGQAVFDTHCASCHGTHSGPAAHYPNTSIAFADVGTDPVRAQRFGEPEATRLNATPFGDPPLTPSGGYLAQPLTGIWARAPYFHNGSVPDLLGVLDPTKRPARWQRIGSELADYDVDRVGLRFEEPATSPDPNTREGRLVYDTTREGMSNQGHAYGAVLSEEERADLLEYLRSL